LGNVRERARRPECVARREKTPRMLFRELDHGLMLAWGYPCRR
jgi:hypothetical protein